MSIKKAVEICANGPACACDIPGRKEYSYRSFRSAMRYGLIEETIFHTRKKGAAVFVASAKGLAWLATGARTKGNGRFIQFVIEE